MSNGVHSGSPEPDATPVAQRTGEVPSGLEAISRVARAAVSVDDLPKVTGAILAEIAIALRLDATAIYFGEHRIVGGPLRRLAFRVEPGLESSTREELLIDQDAWRLLLTGGPFVFREPASWLTENPFSPPASHWLVLPLVVNGALIGVAAGRAPVAIALDPTAAITLRSLGDVLSAAIATARLRQILLRSELDRERIRLAEALHDGLAQDLALAVRELALLESDPAPERRAESFGRLRSAVHSANRLVRAGLEDLSVALPVGGLGPAVREACDRAHGRGVDVRVTVDDQAQVDGAAAAVVLRVLHEALANSARHAAGAAVAVRLRTRPGGLLLTIADRGPGLTGELPRGIGDGHFGIPIMRERARRSGGTLTVRSRASGGTVVHLRIRSDVMGM